MEKPAESGSIGDFSNSRNEVDNQNSNDQYGRLLFNVSISNDEQNSIFRDYVINFHRRIIKFWLGKMQVGESDEAYSLYYLEGSEGNYGEVNFFLERAYFYAVLGEVERSLVFLEGFIEQDIMTDPQKLFHEPLFVTLRKNKKFKEIIGMK